MDGYPLRYNDISNDYINNNYDIMNILADIVTEAETVGSETNNESSTNSFFEAIKKFIQKIISMIDTAILKFKNAFNKVLLTDKGFRKQLREAEVTRKPLNGVKITGFKYTPESLHAIYSKYSSVVSNIINNFNVSNIMNADNLLNNSKEDFEKVILSKLGIPNDITDMSSLYIYMKKIFRGKKMTYTVMKTEVSKHMKIIDGYLNSKSILNNELVKLKSSTSKIKTQLKVASKNNVTDDARKKILTQSSLITFLYNQYATFISIYFELLVEHMLNSRVILKKIYQI